MLTSLVLAITLVLPAQTPDASWAAALADLKANVPHESQRITRYLTLSAIPTADRTDYVKALIFALNSTSFRSTFAKPTIIADAAGTPTLLRIDLGSLEWDYGSRSARLKELERRGVDFGLKTAEDRRLFANPWERFAKDDPFFFATQVYRGKVIRGWINPAAEAEARALSYSTKFVLRADWLLSRILVESAFGGYYSTLLMLPPKERDLYKVFLVDIEAVDRVENRLRHGGAVEQSQGVALNNRELQLIPSSYGTPLSYIWRTFDFNVDARGEKSVIESHAGTAKHDGREVIGTLPNNLNFYYLCDGGTGKSDGKQVAVVPDNIAQVQTPLLPVKDTRVSNGAKCFECHLPANGIKPFEDVISPAMLDSGIALAIKGKEYDKEGIATLKAATEDYYRLNWDRTIKLQQSIYAASLFECCGLTGFHAATLVLTNIESYRYDLVSLEQAASELGFTVPESAHYMRNAVNREPDQFGDPQPNAIAVKLSTGRAVRRGAFDDSYGDIMRAKIWAWETLVAPVQVPVTVPVRVQYQAQPGGYR